MMLPLPRAALALLPLLLLLSSCREAPDSDTDGAAGLDTTLRINLGGEPETLDPSLNTSLIGSRVLKAVFEGLVWLDQDANPQPAGAVSWEPNDDYTEWTFRLRPEARWHDGRPVTAHDYVYGIRRMATPATAADYSKLILLFLDGAQQYFDAGGLESDASFGGVEAIDDTTLRFRLVGPTPFFPTVVDLTCFYPLREDLITEYGADWALSPETLVGNGAFRLTDIRPNDRYVAIPAETWWDRDALFWETVEFYFITSIATEEAAFRSGSIDITNKVNLATVDEWRNSPAWTNALNFGSYYLAINTGRPPFDDVRVRRAFQISVDRELITNQVLRRGETPLRGIVPDWFPSATGEGTFRDRAGDLVGAPDPAAARALLTEAGYTADNPLPTIEYTYDNTGEDHKLVAEQLQAMWREALGADVRLQQVEWGVRLQRGRDGAFQVLRNGWYGDYLDPMTFLELFETGNAFNRPRHHDERYDELLARARREADPATREDLLAEAERIVVRDNAAIIPLHVYALPMLIQPNIEGVIRNATGDVHWLRARRVGGE